MLHSYSMYTTSFTEKTINAFSLPFVSITHNIFNSELESVGNHFIHIVLSVILQAPKATQKKGFHVYSWSDHSQKQKRRKKKS